jgi:hypothetical protein
MMAIMGLRFLWACLIWLALVGVSLLLASWLFPAPPRNSQADEKALPFTESGQNPRT